MANIARTIAAVGALAGGYMTGRKMAADQDWEEEQRQRQRQEQERQDAERKAAADTLGQAGTTVGAAASGEEALAAGIQARDDAVARATTDADRATVTQQYAPTIQALTAQRGTAGSAGTVYTQGQAQSDYLKKMYALDPTKAAQAEATQLQLDEGRAKAERTRKLREVNEALRTWGEKAIPRGEDGQPVLDNDVMVNMGKKRVLELSQRGLYDDALATARDSMTYATQKIQAEQVERQAAVRDAVAAAGAGDFKKALDVYKRYVPDGSTGTAVRQEKDGSVVVDRVSAVDGAQLPPMRYKNMDQFISTLNALQDSNALTGYIQRTFQHDIESRRLGIEGGRLKVAQDAEARQQGKDDRDTRRQDAVSKGLADYATAEEAGDQKGMSAARRAILANGGKLDKPEVPKPEVKVGQIGDITVSQPTGGGGVQVTNYGPDMKPKGSVSVPAPGASSPGQPATPKTQADFDKLPKGARYIDPQDGKTYIKP